MIIRDISELKLGKEIERILLIGSGPSLNYGFENIEKLINPKTAIILADSGVALFIQKYAALLDKVPVIVFSVEKRRHSYLKALRESNRQPIFVLYQGANWRNLPHWAKSIYAFNIDSDLSFCYGSLRSLGTVMGCALSFVLQNCQVQTPFLGSKISIFFLGIDFCYPDMQIYGRMTQYSVDSSRNRFHTKEGFEFEVALKKTSHLRINHGFALRTSAELIAAKKNFESAIAENHNHFNFYCFSPLGVETDFVTKLITTN